ncbi:MAG: hypothetical protein AAGD38_05300 [Acidobacteriota bacterium]
MKHALLVSLLLGSLSFGTTTWAADPFYEGLLQDGSVAMRAGLYESAAENLRLACFGLLDEPELLVVGLVRLAQTQAALEDDGGYAATVRRIVEVERLTQGYSTSTRLPELERKAFEDLLAEQTLAEELENTPAFAGVVARLRAAVAAAGAAADTESVDEDDEERSAADEDERAATTSDDARPSIDGDIEDLRTRLGAASDVDELTGVFTEARRLADANPDVPEAQLLAAESAYRIARWKEVVTYGKRGDLLDTDRPVLLFYYAIALFETGETEEAASVLERALPGLPDTEYVQRTRDRILGN